MILNIWKEFKVLSRFIQKCIYSSYLLGLRFVQNPFFLLAGALSYDEKICQSVALFWFGLWDVRVSSNILLTSRNPKSKCWLSRIFGDRFGGKDGGLWPYNTWSQQVEELYAFLYDSHADPIWLIVPFRTKVESCRKWSTKSAWKIFIITKFPLVFLLLLYYVSLQILINETTHSPFAHSIWLYNRTFSPAEQQHIFI